MAAYSHVKSNTGADFTGTVTVHNSQASTTTIAATDLVRPGDWNSAHNFYQTLSGNTSNSSTMSGTNMVFGGTGAITLAASTAAGAGTVWVSAPPQSVLTYAGNVSLSSNGSTITVSGIAPTFSAYPFVQVPLYSSSCVSGTSGGTGGSTQHTLTGYLCPFMLDEAVSYGDFEMLVSAGTVAGTGSMSFGHMVGIYTLNAGTAFSLDRSYQWVGIYSQNSQTAQTWQTWWGTNSTSNSGGWTGNSSASVTGVRQLLMNTAASTLSAGQYFIVHMYTARSSASLIGQPASAFYHIPAAGSGSTYWTGGARFGQSTTGQPWGKNGWMGIFSTTTNNSNTGMPCLPASINTTAITGTGGSSQWRVFTPIMYT